MLKALRKSIILSSTVLVLGLGVFSCEEDLDKTFGTVPGLFVHWKMNRIESDCTQSGFTSGIQANSFVLVLNRNQTFLYEREGFETISGEFTFNDESITFIPPIYPQSVSVSYEYSFTGRNFSTTTTEVIDLGNGAIETCDIKRVYRLDNY